MSIAKSLTDPQHMEVKPLCSVDCTYWGSGFIIGGLSHNLAINFISKSFKFVTIHQNCIDTVNLVLVFQ